MKMLVILALTMMSMMAFAEGDTKEGFDMKKSKALESIDKRITGLNELKTCVSGATDKETLKECRKAHKTKMKGMRKHKKGKRKGMKKEKK